MPQLVLKVCFGVLAHTPTGRAHEQGQWHPTIHLQCSSSTNPVTSVTLTYMYSPQYVHLPFPPSHPLLLMYHHLHCIRHSHDDDACIGIETVGNKVSLWLESNMNNTSSTLHCHP